jgi:hypothetical protein
VHQQWEAVSAALELAATSPSSVSKPTVEAQEPRIEELCLAPLEDGGASAEFLHFRDNLDDAGYGGDLLLAAAIAIKAPCLAPPDQLTAAAAKGPSAGDVGARLGLAVHPQHLLAGRRPPRGRLRGPPLGCARRGPLPFLCVPGSGLSRPPQSGVAVPRHRPPRGRLRWSWYPR